MLDLLIIVFLILGFFIGLKRGFILQVIHFAGFIISIIVAFIYFDDLAPKLKMWVPYPQFSDNSSMKLLFDQANIEDMYYRAIAFVLIFFAVKILLQMIGSMLDFVSSIPILRKLNIWAGGILGFIEVYFIIFIILYISALLPVESIQTPLNDSIIMKGIVEHTPFLSQQLRDLWIE
ncbi:CvpA family protein [Bacillus aquiflavi]|uniref:CvpA family protein n=1 Tax=Bacillus aquiflavi TaxID=2672567 RepID=UPI001CA9C124|nr:CvpA family protein [Bacillus aquiflavi]UAC47500.1 CvpA family protein [Bacillus aquiflavi]